MPTSFAIMCLEQPILAGQVVYPKTIAPHPQQWRMQGFHVESYLASMFSADTCKIYLCYHHLTPIFDFALQPNARAYLHLLLIHIT